jgi:hypothetical protein
MGKALKLLSLGLLAAAASTIAVTNTSAESQPASHFTSEADHTILSMSAPGESHTFEVGVAGLVAFTCGEIAFEGTTSTKTFTDFTITPTYKKCHTTGEERESLVTTNGCTYKFTAPNKEATKTSNTFDLVCPAGKSMVIEDPGGCRIRVPAQTGLGNVGYTTIVENNKHAITLTMNVMAKEKAEIHFGICSLATTNQTFYLAGSGILKGFNTFGEQVGITATGSVN